MPDFHQKSFRIKHDDDKFFTRFLSKETSRSYPSFRVYYGDVSSAVPFTWETRPGTPKHPSSAHSQFSHIPPLTPPPSYYKNSSKTSSTKHPRSKLLLHTSLRRMKTNPEKPDSGAPSCLSTSSSFSSSLSLSSSSRSLFSEPVMTPTYVSKRRRFLSWGSSFDHRGAAVDGDCPSKQCKQKGDRIHRGNYAMFITKIKAFLSIIGRGSS